MLIRNNCRETKTSEKRKSKRTEKEKRQRGQEPDTHLAEGGDEPCCRLHCRTSALEGMQGGVKTSSVVIAFKVSQSEMKGHWVGRS